MLGNGVFIEEGAFVDIGTVEINPHRHILAKNARIIGMVNHSYPHYYTSMQLMQRWGNWFPFDKMVTHKFKIEDAGAGDDQVHGLRQYESSHYAVSGSA